MFRSAHPLRALALLLVVYLCSSIAPAHSAGLQIDPLRFNALIEAGDLHSAKQWLNAGLDPDFEGDRIGSGMMIGAWEGNIAMMELFLRHGADVNHRNGQGEQALMHAAWKGQTAAAQWLLDHGARVNREGTQWSALHYAVFAGHEAVARLLMEQGADIEARAPNGSTVLMMAAREGHETLARLLLERGADPDAINEQGDNALTWALRHGNVRIAQAVASAERIATAARVVAQAPPSPRSEPAPQSLSNLVAELRAARAAGRSQLEVLNRYETALKAHTAQTQSEKRSPAALEIRARRDAPGDERARLRYAPR
jgi:hypothetical protein